MRLSDKQIRFTKMIAQLIIYADSLGYGLTFGDAYRSPKVFGERGEEKGYGEAYSNHKVRLAVDFNLFIDGRYVTEDKPYQYLHDFWKLLGGETIKNDLNHFSLQHEGRKWVN